MRGQEQRSKIGSSGINVCISTHAVKKLLKYRGKRNWKASGEGAVARKMFFSEISEKWVFQGNRLNAVTLEIQDRIRDF